MTQLSIDSLLHISVTEIFINPANHKRIIVLNMK